MILLGNEQISHAKEITFLDVFLATRAGESAVLVSLNSSNLLKAHSQTKDSCSLTLFANQCIIDLHKSLKNLNVIGIKEAIIGFDSLLVEFDDDRLDYYQLIQILLSLDVPTIKDGFNRIADDFKVHSIEVCYDLSHTDYPHDRAQVCFQNKIQEQTIVDMHTAYDFHVFAVGFMPNFAYLGELPKALQIQRLSSPRLKVPSGAVAIADNQTAVYPSTSPGGWHIIGYTPINLMNRCRPRVAAGDKVRFESISESTFWDTLKENEARRPTEYKA